jgi:hypothetical protein
MKIRFHLLCCVAMVLLAAAQMAVAQWDKRPSSEWSEREAQKLLNDSPWAQTQTFSDLSQMTGNNALNSGQSRVAQDIHVNFRVRFLSAKPVRQAVARDMELKQKGKLDPQLAAQLNAFAAADFPDFIVITVVCDAPQRNVQLQEAQALLQTRTTADLKNNTYLELKSGTRLFLQEYQPPRNDGLGARFVFPRLVNNEPFLNANSGEVRFYSELSPAGGAGPTTRSGAAINPAGGNPAGSTTGGIHYKLNLRFKITDMNYLGKLEY